MFSYTIVFIYLTAISLRLANSCITTRLQTKMPKLKTLDQFIKQRNVKNFPSLPPHPFLENINHLINQQQANATNTQKLTQGPQEHVQKYVNNIQVFEQAIGSTQEQMVSNLSTKMIQNPVISPTAHLSQQLKYIQYKLNNLTVERVSTNIADHAISQKRRPETGYQPYTKQRQNQHCLYYKSKQKVHLIKHCPLLTEK